jgi:hypothetical protein
MSKTTATPALLLFNVPVAILPYRAGQFSWLFLQWALLLGTGWIWLRRLVSGSPRLLFALFLTGFTYTAAWRLHAERGQSYVLLLFLFATWLGATSRPGRMHPFLTGAVAGILIALRPPFLLLVPLLRQRWPGQLSGAFVGLFLALTLPSLWDGPCWSQYAAAMSEHSSDYREGIDPRPGSERFPAEIEGMSTDLLASYATIPYADFSVHALLRGFGSEPIPAWPPLVLVAAGYAVWLWRSRQATKEHLLLGLAIWLFLVDLCLPAYRDNYNDVLIVNIVALGLLLSRRVPMGVWICLAALPVGWATYVFAPMHDWLIDVPSFLFTLGAVVLLFLGGDRIGKSEGVTAIKTTRPRKSRAKNSE